MPLELGFDTILSPGLVSQIKWKAPGKPSKGALQIQKESQHIVLPLLKLGLRTGLLAYQSLCENEPTQHVSSLLTSGKRSRAGQVSLQPVCRTGSKGPTTITPFCPLLPCGRAAPATWKMGAPIHQGKPDLPAPGTPAFSHWRAVGAVPALKHWVSCTIPALPESLSEVHRRWRMSRLFWLKDEILFSIMKNLYRCEGEEAK